MEGKHPPRRRRADAKRRRGSWIQQALRDPVVQIRDEVFRTRPAALHLHEGRAVRRENADDDGADLQLLRGKTGLSLSRR